MNKITIKPDGRLHTEESGEPREALACLSLAVQLEKATTLRSLFRMLDFYPSIQVISPYIPECRTKYSEAPEKDCCTPALDGVEVSKTIEMIGFPDEPRLDVFISVNGTAGKARLRIDDFAYADLLDLPLKRGMLNHRVFGDRVSAMEFETEITLFEMVDGVFWALSFRNEPRTCALRR